MKKVILLIPFILVAAVTVHAQSIGPATLNATGGYTTIGTNEFEWSVGEMTLVTTFSTSGIVVTQGVLQPRDIPTGIPHTALLTNLIVFPNPATSVVNLQYTSAGQGKLTYRLMDMAGQLIRSAAVDVKQGTTSEQINIAPLACATYLLEIAVNMEGNPTEMTTYKIDKLK